MYEVRHAYLECLDIAADLVASPEVAARWKQPSALQQWSIAGLCGHLTRAFVAVTEYLNAEPDPDGDLVDAAEYYATAVSTDDLDSELHRGIRERGDELGALGHAEVVRIQKAALPELRQRMATEPEDRKMRVFQGMVIGLDGYLTTRIVEVVLHVDDLAMSTDLSTPAFPTRALDFAIEALVSTARRRHGDLAVLRALGRRERDAVEALRVF